VARWQAGPQAAPAPSQPAAAGTGRVQVLNGAAVDGIAGRVSVYLRGQGFTLADPGQAPQVFEHTTIVDYTGRPQIRQRLADALGIDPRYVETKPGPDAPAPPFQTDVVLIVGQDYQERWLGN